MKYVAKIGPPGQPDIKSEDIPYLGCFIKEIDQIGILTLQFNITIIPELIYTEDLKKVLKFEITPEDDGTDSFENPGTKYEFDWDVVSFDKTLSTITFQLDFKNADSISMGE